jgi:hypothetical protein
MTILTQGEDKEPAQAADYQIIETTPLPRHYLEDITGKVG